MCLVKTDLTAVAWASSPGDSSLLLLHVPNQMAELHGSREPCYGG